MATKKTTTKEAAVEAPKNLILKNPRITEKAANAGKYNIYVFDVAFGATKNEIKKAVSAQYKVAPIKVNTINPKPKTFWRRGTLGVAKRTKKAYVVVPKGSTINLM